MIFHVSAQVRIIFQVWIFFPLLGSSFHWIVKKNRRTFSIFRYCYLAEALLRSAEARLYFLKVAKHFKTRKLPWCLPCVLIHSIFCVKFSKFQVRIVYFVWILFSLCDLLFFRSCVVRCHRETSLQHEQLVLDRFLTMNRQKADKSSSNKYFLSLAIFMSHPR